MKRILSVITLLIFLVSSVFATDWVRYGIFENEEVGTCVVSFDYDATEPFELENESIEYFLYLQRGYEKVEVYWYENVDSWWCNKGVEHNCYATLEMYEDYRVEYHVNSDGSVTEYVFSGFKNPENEE